MITETIQSDELITPEYELTPEEWAEFQKDYAQWCLEVELSNFQIISNKESRND